VKYPVTAPATSLTVNKRDDFLCHVETAACISDGTPMAWIDWDAVIAALDGGRLPASGGEQRIVGIAASLAAGHPVSFRSEARQAAQGPALRLYALGAAVVFLPFALVATVIEVAARNGGTIYVEARRDAKTPARWPARDAGHSSFLWRSRGGRRCRAGSSPGLAGGPMRRASPHR
jgi:hypothetical protein